MKKAALVLTIAFCIAVAAPLKWASAASDIYFTVVNDRLLKLSDDTMPVEINNVYYVPLSVFNQSSLSTYTIYDRSKRTATIYSDDKSLIFEFGSGNTYDHKGQVYNFQAIYYNSGVYVPAYRTCQFFGFSFLIYSNNVAMFMRIKNSNSSISDDDFARLSALQMQSMLNQYLNDHAVPSSPPIPSPSVTAPSEKPIKHANIYLSIRGLGSSTVSILNSLAYYGYKALFFVTADEIKENPDLLRRIAGSGHGIGIICKEDIPGDYSRASSLLREAANLSSIIISLDAKYSAEFKNAAESLGLIIWNDSETVVYGYNKGASVSDITQIIEDANGRLDISFSGDMPSLIREALRVIYLNDFNVAAIKETVKTHLNGV